MTDAERTAAEPTLLAEPNPSAGSGPVEGGDQGADSTPSPRSPSAVQRGSLLKTSREAAGLSEADAAEVAGVKRTTWQGYETARRGEDQVRAEARRSTGAPGLRAAVSGFAVHLGSPDALFGLWESVGTVDVLNARHRWSVNFFPPGAPCWVWIRSSVPTTADLHWGLALHGRTAVPAGRGGIIVQFPTSVRNPPLELVLDKPGWVDSGQGKVTPVMAEALGAHVVTGQQVHQALRRARRAQWLREHLKQIAPERDELRQLARDLDISWDLVRPHLPAVLLPPPPRALDVAELPSGSFANPAVPADRDSGNLVVRKLLLSPAHLRALRAARGFAEQELADAASRGYYAMQPGPYDDPPPALTRGTLQRLLNTGAVPRAPLVLPRLDMLLHVDGRLGFERTHDSDDQFGVPGGHDTVLHTVHFPFWWTGPVWLQAIKPQDTGAAARARLLWGPWMRNYDWKSLEFITTRKAPSHRGDRDQPPLQVYLPKGWRLRAGTGVVSTASDIGESWRPKDLAATRQVLSESIAAVNAARTLRR
jgi:hypothetical protein